MRARWLDLSLGVENYWFTNSVPTPATPGGSTTIDAGATALLLGGFFRPLRRERMEFCELLLGLSVGPAWRRIGGVNGLLIAFASEIEVSLLLYPSRRSHWFIAPTLQYLVVGEGANSHVGPVLSGALGIRVGYAGAILGGQAERDESEPDQCSKANA
jgi:hypothetical protein